MPLDPAYSYPKFNKTNFLQNHGKKNENEREVEGIKVDKREIEAAFQFFDVYNKKELSPQDLKLRLSAFYPHLSNKEYKFLISEPNFTVDTLKKILDNNTLKDYDPIKEAFKVFDPHDTGYIDKSLLRKVMSKLGYGTITQEDMKVLIDTADADGDGMISFQDFKRMTTMEVSNESKKSRKGDKE